MNPLESALLAAIAAEPDDADRRLVYADWLEEHGRDGEAAGWRWVVAEGRVPRHCAPQPEHAFWYLNDRGASLDPDDIPPALFGLLAGATAGNHWRYYPTRLAAERDLARAYGLALAPS